LPAAMTSGEHGETAGAGQPGYLDQPVSSFLDRLAAGTPAPGGGCAAALVVAQAAALCAMTARLSVRQLSAGQATSLLADGERLRRTAASLVDEDARGYLGVLAATRRAASAATPSEADAQALAAALSHASDVPMLLTELAAEVASLASVLAATGNPRLRGDATTAGILAAAGARAAATLVRINLASAPEDPRLARIDRLLAELPAISPNHP
jgi:methenyltetrahydrofolate cyclohydrolase